MRNFLDKTKCSGSVIATSRQNYSIYWDENSVMKAENDFELDLWVKPGANPRLTHIATEWGFGGIDVSTCVIEWRTLTKRASPRGKLTHL